MFEVFKAKAEAVSSEVHRFTTKNKAMDFVMDLLKKEGIRDTPGFCAVWVEGSFLEGVDKKALVKKIPGLTFDVTRQTAADSKIGISQMDWAAADTGTLAQDSTAVEQRLASSLPLIHVALVATDKILADLPSVLSKLNPKESGYIAMITGPSRTADIERVLTIGVHGPERLIIVFVDELGGTNE